MASMDIFKEDPFSMVELTDAMKDIAFIPQLLGSLNIFEEKGVFTRSVAIEKKGQTLSLIETSADGEAPKQESSSKRTIQDFRTTRLADAFTLFASEVGDMRAFGSNSELAVVMAEYGERMSDLRGNMDLTHEYHKLGSLQGKLLDADGTSVIYDYFAEFGITEAPAIDFALGTDTTNVRTKCHELTRAMARASKGAFTSATSVHALCGDEWFDKLIEHPTVVRSYENWAAAADLRKNIAFDAFTFGGITFHNYRGTDDNSTVAIPVGEAKFFPKNARGVFKKFMAPAKEFSMYHGTKGQDTYAMNVEDKDRGAYVKGELYSYPLYICTKPEILRKATTN